MKKQLLSLMLAAVLIVSLFPLSASAADITNSGTCGDNLIWTLDSDGLLTICGEGEMTDFENGTPIELFENCSPFYGNHNIRTVLIESGVTSIGSAAFQDCANLTSVVIPDSVTKIGSLAFASCRNLESAKIPDLVVTIEEGTFYYCFKLASVTIPSSVTSVGARAFEGCTELKDVYYGGTQEQWDAISIHERRNQSLLEATIHFSSPTECPSKNFTDVDFNAYYHIPMDWAVENGVTTGVTKTTFEPNRSCSRAQMVTFLWRAMGSPEPTVTNPFADVPNNKYYTKAVLWALEQGITTGVDKTHFAPDRIVTRAQTVTFLWRMEGKPEPTGGVTFPDVPASATYAKAVSWASEQGITTGTNGRFNPSNDCTRAQIVTFLYRTLAG